MRIRLTSAVLACAAMASVAGCSGADEPPAAPPAPTVIVTRPAPTVTVTVTATPTPPKPDQPLKLNQWAELDLVKFRVVKFNPNSVRQDEPTVSGMVEACVTAKEPITFSWDPWSAIGKDHSRYPASSESGGADPRPEYPFAGDEVFNPGDCVKGWIVFEAEAGAVIGTIRYGNQDGDTAVWAVG